MPTGCKQQQEQLKRQICQKKFLLTTKWIENAFKFAPLNFDRAQTFQTFLCLYIQLNAADLYALRKKKKRIKSRTSRKKFKPILRESDLFMHEDRCISIYIYSVWCSSSFFIRLSIWRESEDSVRTGNQYCLRSEIYWWEVKMSSTWNEWTIHTFLPQHKQFRSVHIAISSSLIENMCIKIAAQPLNLQNGKLVDRLSFRNDWEPKNVYTENTVNGRIEDGEYSTKPNTWIGFRFYTTYGCVQHIWQIQSPKA